MKKFLIIFLILFLFGCSSKKEIPSKQTFIFNNGVEPETLDPALMTGVPEHTIAIALFEGLTTHDPKDLHPLPGMAERWELSPDGRTYTFYLRKAKWSNGDEVTANDFYYSWERVLNPNTASYYAYQLYYIKNAREYNAGEIKDFNKVGIKVINEYTFQVTLKERTPFFLDITSFDTLMPVNKKCVETYENRWTRAENIVTNGPFLLKSWKQQQKITMVKNPDYWDAENVKLEKIIALAIESQDTALKSYLAGEVDWIRNVPLPQIETMKKREDYYASPFLTTYFYRFNVTKPPFNDVRVRKAFNIAVDKEKITKYVLKAGQIPAGTFVPHGIPGYIPPEGLPYSVKEAKKLLAEAGYPDGKNFPKVELLYNTLEAHKRIAEAIQQMWKENLGIKVNLVNQEWKVYLKSVRNLDYQISRAGWIGDYTDPNTFLDMFVTGGGNNNTGWSNKKYDSLIAKAASTANPEERIKIFKEAEKILTEEELPIMPIYFYVNVGMVRPYVRGFYQNIRGLHPFKYVYIEQE